MTPALLLHAAVPTPEAQAALGRALGVRALSFGPVAAIVGPVRRESSTRVALRHARIVASALRGCTSVVPFRSGAEFPSEVDVRGLLAENRAELSTRLDEVADRVEMGLKVRIPAPFDPDDARLESALDRIRSLTSGRVHCVERRKPVSGAVVLEGCYLVPRDHVEAFWTGVTALRDGTGLRVLGTGPWAPYSFCELSLRPAPQADAAPHPLDRRPS
jgi:hypothetical protein